MEFQFIKERFQSHANPFIAKGQGDYMKNNFPFLGISSPSRKEIQQELWPEIKKLPKNEAFQLVQNLWELPEREFHYFAQEIVEKHKNSLQIDDIKWIKKLISSNSWWDTVDFLAPKILGHYFRKYPEMRESILTEWLESGNMWLQRSCVLYQLKYKSTTDTEYLSFTILSMLGSKQFFINKAIGWVLREYAKTNPQWVVDFVNQYQDSMATLSKKEALRIVLKGKI